MVLPLYDDNPFKRAVLPWVTWTIIAINVFVFLFEIGSTDEGLRAIWLTFGAVPAEITRNAVHTGGFPAELTLLTYQFLHSDFWHILGNMIFLFVLGDDIEDALGPWKFIGFYLVCGVVGGLVFVATNTHSALPLIGASGSVAGVIAAYLMVRPCAKVSVLVLRFVVRVDAYWVIGGWALWQLFNIASNDGVAYWAHIGGMIAGAALLPLLRQPGVELFECVRQPELVDAPAASDWPADRDTR